VKDPVCLFLTSLLKMAHGVRDGGPFQVCRDLLSNLEGIDLSTEKGTARSLRAVQEAVAAVTELTRDRKPADLDYQRLSSLLLPQERREQFARTFKEYQNREYLNSIIDGCLQFFGECAVDTPTWPAFVANIEGRDAVKIMTIHKSKGLEYHTVIFTEFNDDAFWNNKDDVNVFFVALSRARERIRFSLTQDAKGFNNVRRFLEKLQESGVSFTHK
jgi:ATP-dependent DNA helicase Rep